MKNPPFATFSGVEMHSDRLEFTNASDSEIQHYRETMEKIEQHFSHNPIKYKGNRYHVSILAQSSGSREAKFSHPLSRERIDDKEILLQLEKGFEHIGVPFRSTYVMEGKLNTIHLLHIGGIENARLKKELSHTLSSDDDDIIIV